MMENDYDKLEAILEDLEMEEEVKEDILDTMEEYSDDEDFSYLYYDAEQDRKAIENGLRSEARAEGLAEGREEGIKEGIKEGTIQTKQEIAKSMKSENIDINIISKCTGLTENEINNL